MRNWILAAAVVSGAGAGERSQDEGEGQLTHGRRAGHADRSRGAFGVAESSASGSSAWPVRRGVPDSCSRRGSMSSGHIETKEVMVWVFPPPVGTPTSLLFPGRQGLRAGHSPVSAAPETTP